MSGLLQKSTGLWAAKMNELSRVSGADYLDTTDYTAKKSLWVYFLSLFLVTVGREEKQILRIAQDDMSF